MVAGDSLGCLPSGWIERAKVSNGQKLQTVVKSKKVPEWLPNGWFIVLKIRNNGSEYECYIDPATGCKFYSKAEAYQYLETVDNGTVGQNQIGTSSVSKANPLRSQTIKSKSSKSKQKKAGIGMHSNVVIERGPADGLPPGWIKELRTMKCGNKMKIDPYYTDPISGCIFRSKLDALRYLETGDIDKCAIKPWKSDINDLELINGNISSPSAVDGKKSTRKITGKQLFAGTGSSVAPEAENIEEKHSLDSVKEKCSEANEIPDPKTEGSKRKRGNNVSAEKGLVSTPAAFTLQEEKLPENGMVEHSNRKTQNKNALRVKRT